METNKKPLFELGVEVSTPEAMKELRKARVSNDELLKRHVRGDWGDLSQADREENELAIKKGYRILSAYTLPTGQKIWVITEADRSATTILKPDEY